MEITRTLVKSGFQQNGRLENTFFQKLKYVFSLRISQRLALLKPITPEVWKTFPKRVLVRKLNFFVKWYFFQSKRKNLDPSCTYVLIGYLAPCFLGTVTARNREIMKPERILVSNRLYRLLKKYLIKTIHNQFLRVNWD